MRVRFRLVVGLAVVAWSVGTATSQDRKWEKYHQRIEMDQVMAEYTTIRTTDELSPELTRYLYRDAAGERLVIHCSAELVKEGDVVTGLGPFQVTITRVGTGEHIDFLHDDQGTVVATLGGATFDYVDDPQLRPLSPVVRGQAATFLTSNSSPEFRDALVRFASVTARFSNVLSHLGSELAELFFPNIDFGRVTDRSSDETDGVLDFDPYTTPPGPFEVPFGQAYYE